LILQAREKKGQTARGYYAQLSTNPPTIEF
jgi:hypothetical protein